MLRVKEICASKGITIKVLAEKMGISAPTLSTQINGNPKLDTIEKIAAALDVHITELFETPGNLKVNIEFEGENYRVTEKNIIEYIKSKNRK